MTSTRAGSVDDLGGEYLELHATANPFAATTFGLPGHDAEVPDVSAEAQSELARTMTAVRDRVVALVPDELDDTDRTSRALLAHDTQAIVNSVEARETEWQLGGLVGPGDEIYRRLVEQHTTTLRTPQDLHETGLRIGRQLRAEFGELGGRVLGTSDFAEVQRRLREDPSLCYFSGEEMLRDVREALRRAEDAVPDWFGRRHRAPCEVAPMNAAEADTSVLGYYQPPAGDGSRGGRCWLNTSRPATRTRYECEALAFHESVPGHHMQFALAQELDGLPAYRRFAYVTAFGEGWGLYTERLADEMGLYSDDLARFGMVSFDAWRAARLVVDTGIHAFGWSRGQAIDYMWDNTALTMVNIVNEVDRYISMPGQALAYMTGRLEIVRLREMARSRLGSRFDIKAFHDTVLGSGSIPLSQLADVVERWVTTQAGREQVSPKGRK